MNPFLTVMNFKISFKTWLNVTRDHKKGIKIMDKLDSKTYLVPVDIENEVEYTSEDEASFRVEESFRNRLEEIRRITKGAIGNSDPVRDVHLDKMRKAMILKL